MRALTHGLESAGDPLPALLLALGVVLAAVVVGVLLWRRRRRTDGRA